jgi:hypothetical protein
LFFERDHLSSLRILGFLDAWYFVDLPKTPVTPATTKPKIVVVIAITAVRTISPRSPGMSMLLRVVQAKKPD